MVGPVKADDPKLLQLVKERYIMPPSKKPYNLKMNEAGYNISIYAKYRTNIASWIFLSEVITMLFKSEPPGFFVEAGALDGEYLSNTLDLETQKGWTGLLVEADGQVFHSLTKKNRKSWISHTCLAAFPYPHQTTLVRFTNPSSEGGEFAYAVRGYNAVLESKDVKQRLNDGFPVYETTQCIPLQTLLHAIGIRHVNLVSLDVEGVEMKVLQSFWGSEVTVDVWIVEHKHEETEVGRADQLDTDFIYWFQSKGYTMYTHGYHYPVDYIFIRNGSDFYERVFDQRPTKYRRIF